MTGHALPDDPSQWPSNPYHVLGVSESVSRNELRKAYHGLLRLYKPEHAPEQFRRVREAYEAALQGVQWREQWGEPPRPSPTSEPTSSTTGDDNAPSADVQQSQPETSATPALDPPEAAWQSAITGDKTIAYKRLRTAQHTNPGAQDVYLRLYWLLATHPELDRERSRTDWLVEGMRMVGPGAGALRELLRREIVHRRIETFDERMVSVIVEHIPWPGGVELVEARWLTIPSEYRHQIMASDLNAIAPRLEHDAPEHWLRLLLSATRQLTLDTSPDAVALRQRCCAALEKQFGNDPRYYDPIASIDFFAAMAAQWSDKAQIDEALSSLLQRGWSEAPDALRPALLAYLGDKTSAALLRALSWMAIDSPLLLGQFGRLLANVEQMRPPLDQEPYPQELAVTRVREFMALNPVKNYEGFRETLLDFCVQEEMTLEEFAQAMPTDSHAWVTTNAELTERIAGDWPLRYTLQAYRLYWR